MATDEREITTEVQLCNRDGRSLNPDARGWSRKPLHRANMSGSWGRTKRWDYWAVLAGNKVFGLVYADVDYLGLASAWWCDLPSGRSGGAEVAVPLAKGFRLPEISGGFPLYFASKKLRLRVADSASDARDEGPITRIEAQWTERNGTPASVDFTVSRPVGHESLNVVIPWSDTRFNFTTKDQALPVVGRFTLGDEVTELGTDSGPAWGVLDVGRGRWPYSTNWNWGGGSAVAESGEVVGIQFGAKWTEGTGFTENGVTIDGRLNKIGNELRWEYSWAEPMKPWRVVDPVGELDLTLTPLYDKHGKTSIGVMSTEVHQVFGRWNGFVTAEDGRRIQVVDGQGFAEESRNRW